MSLRRPAAFAVEAPPTCRAAISSRVSPALLSEPTSSQFCGCPRSPEPPSPAIPTLLILPKYQLDTAEPTTLKTTTRQASAPATYTGQRRRPVGCTTTGRSAGTSSGTWRLRRILGRGPRGSSSGGRVGWLMTDGRSALRRGSGRCPDSQRGRCVEPGPLIEGTCAAQVACGVMPADTPPYPGTPGAGWPAVSVVMPVLDEERHLREAVEGVLAAGVPRRPGAGARARAVRRRHRPDRRGAGGPAPRPGPQRRRTRVAPPRRP